jgi:transcription-repair coupling factor (superfamily II helicase)
MYKKIAAIRDDEDEAEVLDELIDRFGEPPAEVENLVKVSHIRAMAEKAGIIRITRNQRRLFLIFWKRTMTPELVARFCRVWNGNSDHGGVNLY